MWSTCPCVHAVEVTVRVVTTCGLCAHWRPRVPFTAFPSVPRSSYFCFLLCLLECALPPLPLRRRRRRRRGLRDHLGLGAHLLQGEVAPLQEKLELLAEEAEREGERRPRGCAESRDHRGCTLLMIAVEGDHVELVSMVMCSSRMFGKKRFSMHAWILVAFITKQQEVEEYNSEEFL